MILPPRCRRLVLLAGIAMLWSCKSVPVGGLEPVSPPVDPSRPYQAQQANSRQPELKWQTPTGSPEVFDLIIFSGMQRRHDNPFYVPKAQLYYRENIRGTSHTVQTALPPDTVCVWAVRTRDGDNVGLWSRYRQAGFVISGLKEDCENQWWRFKTPKQ